MNDNTLYDLKDGLLTMHRLGVKLSFCTFWRWNIQNSITKADQELKSITTQLEILRRWNASQSNSVKKLIRSFDIDIYAILQIFCQLEELIEKIRLQFDHIRQLKQHRTNFFASSSSTKGHVNEILKLKEDMVLKIEELRTFVDKLSKLENEIVRGRNLRNIHDQKFINTTEKQQPDIYISFEKGTPEGMLYDAIFNPKRSNRDILAVGPGGTGKTVTVCSICSKPEIQYLYPGGVFFSKLKPESDSSEIVAVLSKFLRICGSHLNANEVMKIESTEEAIDLASKSLGKRPYLFVFDNISFEKTMDVDILTILSPLAHFPGSKIVYTTRNQEVNWGEQIEFSSRSKSNSKRILLTASGLQDPKESSFQNILNEILRECTLPMELSMYGRLLREISHSLHENEKDLTWLRYSAMYSTNKKDNVSKFECILEKSIEFLKDTRGVKYEEYFAFLSVLQPFHEIPVEALYRLWHVSDERGKEIVEGFKQLYILQEHFDFSRTDCHRKLFCHDFILNFARKKSKQANAAYSIFERWIYSYIFPIDGDTVRDRRPQQDSAISIRNICEFRLTSSIFNETNFYFKNPWYENNMTLEFINRWHTVLDDGYIFKTALNMLNSALMFDEAIWLVQEPKWVINRLQKFGLSDVLGDINIAASFVGKTLCWNKGILHLLAWFRFLKETLTKVVRDNEKDRPDGLVWTSLYKRLCYYYDPLGKIQCFQRKIESQSQKPWIKPQRISYTLSTPSNSNSANTIFQSAITIGHTGWVWAMDSTEDGRTVVSGSSDRTVRVWVRENGMWTNSALSGHTSTVFTVSINDAGDLINSRDKDGNSIVWSFDQKQWKKCKCQCLRSQFSLRNKSSMSPQIGENSSLLTVVSKLSGHLTTFLPSGFVTAVSYYPYIEFYEISD